MAYLLQKYFYLKLILSKRKRYTYAYIYYIRDFYQNCLVVVCTEYIICIIWSSAVAMRYHSAYMHTYNYKCTCFLCKMHAYYNGCTTIRITRVIISFYIIYIKVNLYAYANSDIQLSINYSKNSYTLYTPFFLNFLS